MWCRCCNLETNENYCSVCGSQTVEDIPIQIYWCKNCSIPIIHLSTAVDKGICPICKGKTYYLTPDLRPVFPEERTFARNSFEERARHLHESFCLGSI